MRRMKRFVLAERTEKVPMWTSSDNLQGTTIVKITSDEDNEQEKEEEMKNCLQPRTSGLT